MTAPRYLGEVCVNGHDGWRYTANDTCCACSASQSKLWRAANKEKLRLAAGEAYRRDPAANLAAQARWRSKNGDRVRARNAAFREANPDYSRVASAEWHSNHADEAKARMSQWHADNRDKVRARQIVWDEMNQDIRNALRAKRRAMELQAAPNWVDWAVIKAIYKERERIQIETGVPHQVDHIVPLVSDVVCGLHVPWNLRVITKAANLAKKNRFIAG